MRRLSLAALVVLLCVAYPSVSAGAQTPNEVSGSIRAGVVDRGRGSVSIDLSEATRRSGVSPASSAVDEGKVWVDWPAFRDVDGRRCMGRGGRLVDSDAEVDGVVRDPHERFQRTLTDAVLTGKPVRVCDRAGRQDPVAVLRRTIRRRLPPVKVAVQPPGGEALVGWNVYLTLGRDPVFTPSATAVSLLSRLVKVDFEARATARVDWDDQQTVGEIQPSVQRYPVNAGVRWEDRDVPGVVPIRHLYQDVGERTITVTDVWDVAVRAAGVGQWRLTVPMDPVRVPLRLIQSQAVVTDQH